MDEIERITNAWAMTKEGSFTPVAADLEAIRCALKLNLHNNNDGGGLR